MTLSVLRNLLLLCITFCSLVVTVKAKSPNVLFIAIDDLNDWAEGFSSYREAKTPNIKQLADRGVMFTNAHCAAPACNPSRVSVMTGVRPSTSGVYYNWQDWRECKNLKNVTTLPQHFKNHGYKVLGGGKLYHAASLSEWGHEGYLDARSWDQYYPSKTQQLVKEVTPETRPVNGNVNFYRGFFDWAPLEIEDSEMGDAKVVNWASKQLLREHEKPLFLAVGIYRPHIPWYTPQKWFNEYPIDKIRLPDVQASDLEDVPKAGQEMARTTWQAWIKNQKKWKAAVQGYLASVSFADAMVGKLLQALHDGPMADNTAIILWSDHGYHLGHKEHWEKFALWEQTTHVPLVIVEPKQNHAGKLCTQPTSLLDIYPTLAELCGLPLLDHLEGESLVPLLQNPNNISDRSVIITQGMNNHAVRSQNWRYIRYADGSEELYDHRIDPNEFNNLSDSSEFKFMKKKLAAELPSINSELFPQNRRTPRP